MTAHEGDNKAGFDSEADYVIVGAGSAGCVLANRLSADGRSTVRLLEFGGGDASIFIRMPAAFSIPLNKAKYDWGYHTEPEPGLNGRRLHQARGKVLGGSSSINGMAYVRGSAGDFDSWARLGAHGWGYADVLPYFKRLENSLHGETMWRGGGGPIATSNGNGMRNPLYGAFIEAGRQAGYGVTEDYNGYRQEGFGPMEMTVANGVRCSTARAYLGPARGRSNLEIETHVLARHVIMDGKQAVGVAYRRGERTYRVRARKEVILAASTFNSPKLLMLSGIGPADHLADRGIQVVHNLPGVGENLHDHLEAWVQHACREPITLNGQLSLFGRAKIGLNWLLFRKGLGISNQFEANGYIRSQAGMRFPDLQYHFLPGAIAYDGSSAVKGHGFQAHLGPNKPKSRGRVRLAADEPEAPPSLLFNYLREDADRQAFRDGLRLTREIFGQPALDPYRGAELNPGPDVVRDDEIDDWAARNAETAYHPTGTCRMGTDAYAVVDPECRVHGIDGLRVVDSAIMPEITNGNLNAPTIMIGEKAADHILGTGCLPPADVEPFVPDDWETRQRTGTPTRSPDG